MIPELASALAGEAWAVNRVVFGLHDTRDDEGRPLNERRSPAFARKGVVSELRPCPYHDERHGVLMNVSALAQLTRHLGAVTEDAGGFRSMVTERSGWDPMLMTVLDLLAAPARYLLGRPDAPAVPARLSVGYKVGAGFFGALSRLLLVEGRAGVPVSPKGFLEYVKKERLLIGAGEACAGPPNMIERLTNVLMHGLPQQGGADEGRLFVARALADQVRLGAAWSMFDEASERGFFREWYATGRLRPRNEFIRRKLEGRAQELVGGQDFRTETLLLALPVSRSGVSAEPIRAAVCGGTLATRLEVSAVAAIGELLDLHEGAIDLVDPASHRPVASRLVDYLTVYRAFASSFWAIERSLRAHLGSSVAVPLKLHGALFAIARSLDWYSAVSGHRLESTPERSGPIVLKNHRRSVEVIPAAATAV